MKKKQQEKVIIIKLVISIIYLIMITILFVCAYKIFEKDKYIVSLSEVKNTNQYTYIEVYRMSEKFAYYEETNIGLHFVVEKEDTGEWHIYLIAINEDNYDKYKKIVDYTYEKTKKEPKPIKVYGYPTIINDERKQLALNNIEKFIPKENEIKITSDNYEEYFTNSYLDTTRNQEDRFNIILFLTLIIILVLIVLLFVTLLHKNKKIEEWKEDEDDISTNRRK